MVVFKCKMCGGTLEFEQDATVGICDSCGTKQTLPRLNDDRRTNLYDHAEHFEEGKLTCPMCDAKFIFDEGIRTQTS